MLDKEQTPSPADTQNISVYNYETPRDFIHAIFQFKKNRRSSFSLRAWAKQMGFKNPTLLSDVLRGKRQPSERLIECLAKNLLLSQNELDYLKLLYSRANARNTAEKTAVEQLLYGIRPNLPIMQLSPSTLAMLDTWYYFVLIEMTELKDFDLKDIAGIVKKLGHRVSEKEVECALNRLKHLKLLVENSTGKLVKGTGEVFTLTFQEDTPEIKKQLKEIMENFLISYSKHPSEEKDCSSSNLTIEKKDLKKAKDLIREFHSRMWKLTVKGKAEHVYQFNSQFFRITE